jgi:DNA-binding transcriptional ArsR family regulator
VNGDADVAAAAALIGEPTRAALLLALIEEATLPASELAARGRVAASTASEHLARLVAGGLIVGERQGRHRYYRLADPAVATAVEALSAIAPQKPVRSLREATIGEAVRYARTCYDHLAGRLGVELTSSLERDHVLILEGESYRLGRPARTRLAELGIDLGELVQQRRTLVRPCLDWSERRRHVAGALGAALARRLFELEWLRKRDANRSVEVTPLGRARLLAEFSVDVGCPQTPNETRTVTAVNQG